ncbi:MAG: AMP-binding protein [Eubacteriales bacterium]|nr:AMP-binding protein [Eubacteriales bacterium]
MNRPVLDDWILKKITIFNSGLEETKPPNFTHNALERYQLDRINGTLALAAQRSLFYRTRFGAVKLENLSGLSALPFTSPEDLKADPYGMLCVHPNEISRIVTLKTSGSSGPSKRVFFTEPDLELCTDYFHHGMRNLVNEADTVGILFPYATPASVGDQLIKGLGRLGADTVPLFGKSKAEISEVIREKQITSLAGMPAQISDLAETYPQLSTIKTVLLSADFVSDQVRSILRQAWGAEVFEHYGMTEMGLGCAVSCAHQKGYHVREADLYLEIICPDTGRVLPDGQWGEIVFTTLTRTGMPFIRYRTGDISRWKTEPCSCGSKLKLLDYIRDRQIPKGKGNDSAS